MTTPAAPLCRCGHTQGYHARHCWVMRCVCRSFTPAPPSAGETREAEPRKDEQIKDALESAQAGVWDAYYGRGITVEYAQAVDAKVKAALKTLTRKVCNVRFSTAGTQSLWCELQGGHDGPHDLAAEPQGPGPAFGAGIAAGMAYERMRAEPAGGQEKGEMLTGLIEEILYEAFTPVRMHAQARLGLRALLERLACHDPSCGRRP